jgi:transcriptional regulator with XRE-family HTH domain
MGKVQTRFKEGPPRHFIKEWRKHRRLSQERLAERVGVTHGAIGQLERGLTSYTQPMLEALADALQCTPADLIMRNPLKGDAPLSILDGLDSSARHEAIRFIEYLRGTKRDDRTGTDG